MLSLDIRDEINPRPRILSATGLVVKNASGEVVKEIHGFRDAPDANVLDRIPDLAPDLATREAMALEILRRSA